MIMNMRFVCFLYMLSTSVIILLCRTIELKLIRSIDNYLDLFVIKLPIPKKCVQIWICIRFH